MPPRGRKNNKWLSNSKHSTRVASTAVSTASAAAAVPTAPVDEFAVLVSSVGPSEGCITSVATRLGVDIMQLPICLETTYNDAAAMADNNNKFIGSCPYHLNHSTMGSCPYHLNTGFNASTLCGHPNLQLRKCG